MGLAENRAKSAKMAKDLVERGFWHGKRQSKPNANSGGTTFRLTDVGSSKYQRLTATRTVGKR